MQTISQLGIYLQNIMPFSKNQRKRNALQIKWPKRYKENIPRRANMFHHGNENESDSDTDTTESDSRNDMAMGKAILAPETEEVYKTYN